MAFSYEAFKDLVDNSFATPLPPGDGLGQRVMRRAALKKHAAAKRLSVYISYLSLKLRHPEIVRGQLQARENGGLKGDYQWLRLHDLECLIREHAPESVLEYGCGTSSLMFAKLMGNAARFTTVEESQYWLDRMLQIGGPGFEARARTIRADRKVVMRDGEHGVHYDTDHSRHFDLVYVDGPYAQLLPGEENLIVRDPHGILPNFDVELMWENKIYPNVIVVDGRRTTVRRLIQNNPGGQYQVFLRSNYILRARPNFSPFRYHSVFVRS